MTSVVYDTGALLAAERRNRMVWLRHDDLLARGTVPLVPTAVLAQAWRGGPQPTLSRFLRGCHIEVDCEKTARAAGTACAKAGTGDVVDAIVVVTAAIRDGLIVTSDPDDLRKIAEAIGFSLRLRTV